MKLFLTHKSALEYWRLHGLAQDGLKNRQRRTTVPSDPPDSSTLRDVKTWGLSLPLDITVGTMDARRISRSIHSHLLGGSLPEGCIVYVGDGLFVSSPELCFFQMATELPIVKLIELGFELCGSYSLPAPGITGTDPSIAKGFYNRPPLTSIRKLTTFLDQMVGMKGRKRALQASQFIADNSASPMETVLVMLLSLPNRLGGYHLPKPELNAHVVPAKSARHLTRKAYYSLDLFWPDVNVTAEYDSDMFHTGAERIAKDSKRRNDLASIGIEVITITSQQIRNPMEFEKSVKQLASSMGKRLRNNEDTGFLKAQRDLRGLLFASNRGAVHN